MKKFLPLLLLMIIGCNTNRVEKNNFVRSSRHNELNPVAIDQQNKATENTIRNATSSTPIEAITTNTRKSKTNLPEKAASKPQEINDLNSKIIRTAVLRAEVKNYDKIYPAVKRFILQAGGYVAQENEKKSPNYISNTLIIKIPSNYFSSLVDSIEHVVPDLLEKQIQAEDVSETYYDIKTRIKTKKNIEKRYISILNKAKTIKEIIKVEHEIGIIREEIEAAEGQLKLMSHRVNFSTINLTLKQPFNSETIYAKTPTFWKKIGTGFQAGWDGTLSLVIGLVYLWPFLLFVLFLALYFRRVLKKKGFKKSKYNETIKA